MMCNISYLYQFIPIQACICKFCSHYCTDHLFCAFLTQFNVTYLTLQMTDGKYSWNMVKFNIHFPYPTSTINKLILILFANSNFVLTNLKCILGKINSALHSSKVNQMSTGNLRWLTGKKLTVSSQWLCTLETVKLHPLTVKFWFFSASFAQNFYSTWWYRN